MSKPTPSGLSLSDEPILLLIKPETGCCYQVSGGALNGAFVGAVLAELSLRSNADAVEHGISSPLLRRSSPNRNIPRELNV